MENTVSKKYFRKIKRNIPYFATNRRKFLQDFRENLSSYLSERETASEAELIERFGSPEEIACSFLPADNTPEDLKKIRRKNWIVRAVVALFAAILITLAAVFTVYTVEQHNFFHGHYEVTMGEGHSPSHPDAVEVHTDSPDHT